MIKRFLVLFFLFSILNTLLFADPDVSIKVIKQTQTSLTLQVVFPPPELKTRPSDGSRYLEMPGMDLLRKDGYPLVPYISKTFSLPAENVQYAIREKVSETEQISAYSRGSISTAGSITAQNADFAEISYLGLFRRTPLFTVTFFPVRVNLQQGSAEILKSITIDIWVPQSPLAKKTAATQSVPAQERPILDRVFINSAPAQNTTPATETVQALFPFEPGRYQLRVKEDGLYQVTYQDLEDAGVDVESFDTRKLRLWNCGREIPLFIKGGQDGSFDPGDYFEFWGEINRSELAEKYPDIYNDPFSDVNVYWLENSTQNGLRMVEESGALIESNANNFITPKYFTERIHFEQDREFIRFGHRSANIDSAGYTMDHWFYDRGISAVGSRTYMAFLPWPYRTQDFLAVFVDVMMRGLSDSSQANPLLQNHQVDVWLNDAKVASSGTWNNQRLHLISNRDRDGLPQRVLLNGDNQLRLQMDQSGVTDIAVLNWFDVEYYRHYRAHENFIKFRKPDDFPSGFIYQFEVEGFTKQNIEVYKLGVSKLVNSRLDYYTNPADNFNSYRVSFQDEIFYPDLTYIALTPDQKKKPLSITEDRSWQESGGTVSLLSSSNRADYLIITDDLFYENARRLQTYRRQQGLEVEIVRVQDIYDEFNYGIKSPLAIRDFLKYAYENWDQSVPLLYVLFVGDASFDYKQSIATSKKDYVPTFLFETEKYGAAASDFLYSLVSGEDYIPDLIIGRLPVENNSELNAYYDKMVGYESPGNTGEWQTQTLFISGNDAFTREHYTGLPAFRGQNQRLINMKIPDGYFAQKLNTVRDTSIVGGDPNFGGTNTLINYFDDGTSMINFFGHGGGGIWADVYLMSTDDVDRLNNGFRLPFIQSMTCFTGAYENSKINGLAEKLVLEAEKGAIGVLAASGVGWLANDFALGWHLTDLLLSGSHTVGEAILLAKIYYLGINQYVTDEFDSVIPSYRDLKKSMVNHYNLIGDPYIKIPVPPDDLDLSVNNKTPAVDDTVIVSLNAPFASGSGRIELSDENHQKVQDRFIAISNSQAQTTFIIPQRLSGQNLFLNAYAQESSGITDARGQVRLTVDKPLVDSVIVSPRIPQIGETIEFFVYVTPASGINQVRITNLRDNGGSVYTLVLQQVNDNLWKSQNPFGPYQQADTVYFDIQVFDLQGNSGLTRKYPLIIEDPRPDIRILPTDLSFTGMDQIELTALVANESAQALSDVQVSLYADRFSGSENAIYSEMISMEPGEERLIRYPVNPEFIQKDRAFFAYVDVQESVSERNENNNLATVMFPGNLFNVRQEIGTTVDGITGDTITVAENIRFFVTAQGFSASSVLSAQLQPHPLFSARESQPGFTYVPVTVEGDSAVVNLSLRNTDVRFLSAAYLEFTIDTSLVLPQKRDSLHICRYNQKLERWLIVPGTYSGDKISAQVFELGRFAVFVVEDRQKPVIEITVNGRIAYNDMLIPQNPNLAILLQDANGVNLTSGLQILVDGSPLPVENQLVPDSASNANAISVLTTPQLTQGRHELFVSAQDTRGNTEAVTLDFRVASEFYLKVYGNYPNPFGETEDETYISFEIGANQPLDKLEVRFYTVSGRMIRKIKAGDAGQPDQKLLEPGYHEILWDGLDDDGNPVANGVYFAVLKLDLGGQSKEETLKIAVLK